MASLPDVPLQGLYGDQILDHYRNPRLRTPLDNADVEAEEFNPFCGDRVILQLSVDRKGLVADASARSEGCSIIQASASMLAQMTLGKSLEQVESVADRFRSMMQRKPAPGEDMGGLEDLLPLQVVRQFPVRIKCALLPWTALEIGIEDFRARNSR
jgi:nitrogen fixation NifU-like protein